MMVYLDNKNKPMVWRSYRTHPPVASVPIEKAKLCHFIDILPDNNKKPFIHEIQHVLFVAGMSKDYMARLKQAPRIEQRYRSENCKAIFCPAVPILEQVGRHINISGIEDKLHLVLPAYPAQPDNPHEHTGPFTILTISNKFWGRGVPLAIDAFRTLRKKYGSAVQMKLVCEDVPNGYPLVDGLELIEARRLDGKLRSKLYQEASAFLLLSLHESGVVLETMAHGVPTVSTPVGGGSWAIPGQTGFIVEPPFHLYGEGFGTMWKTWDQFQSIVKTKFERGELAYMVTEAVAHIELLMNNPTLVKKMGHAAQAHQRERHSFVPHNEQVRKIYTDILERMI